MKTYTLKSVARRGSMLAAAFVVAGASIFPAVSVSADALNPLTERSLALSSSSPGWSFRDASGNATYAPPNSGANGNKTGNTFSFRVSSDADIKAFDFQYCTTPAGNCMGPGNNTVGGDVEEGTGTRAANGDTEYALRHSDLEIKVDNGTKAEVSTYATKFNALTGEPAGYVAGVGEPDQWDSNTAHPNLPNPNNLEGNYIVLWKANEVDPWQQSTGWTMAASVKQTVGANPGTVENGTSTGKNNFITLTNASGNVSLNPGNYVKVVFFATNTNYITNPGDKEFFVKINSYSDVAMTNLVDGGVTVANVMNRSIEIQTKVLETMDFSVGTVDPNTLESTGSAGSQFSTATGKNQHGVCDPIVQGMDNANIATKNVLKLGDENGEFSLRTDTTYSTHSYWRLSSNSSGGATVYYSGVTLSNTVGDQIDAIGTTASAPVEGSEQFGLALDNARSGNREVSYAKERTAKLDTPEEVTGNTYGVFQNGADNAVTGIHATTLTAVGSNPSYHVPRLSPLKPLAGYGNGMGVVNTEYGAIDTEFAFDPESSAVPAPFADGTQVLDCVTGKMRYIANIAATTPAGIYTTKINYIAAPKY